MVENDVCQSTASQFQAIKQTQIETVKWTNGGSNTHCIVVLVDSFLHLDTSEGAASQCLRSLFVQCASLCWLMGVRWCKRCCETWVEEVPACRTVISWFIVARGAGSDKISLVLIDWEQRFLIEKDVFSDYWLFSMYTFFYFSLDYLWPIHFSA